MSQLKDRQGFLNNNNNNNRGGIFSKNNSTMITRGSIFIY